ncbi:5-formyltetrahydrofolate cyclo-ligase [Dellaglioa carnosa]|uniref:5-formyltetrahydrofolate cyclo-ligase n=1 Tax=Dellaglioa carnosa TaxID=2995136 RepID=A0ABT4JK28_9LACO|nr:5-formyltetrahydrofolate cyclo-ligase [Dellaglioa carnosa]MCZ2490718.1 5-formyltetrahydrofolate cyclo-ligase [Dellaglioa carnosa]MCZ2493796.1 5-formyltetrahydrofolate cyclo-ligase [Dellaglioa carnosa]MDK1730660.1 5-formyltetrahydrofolate cyclo-ligase [Dellaglioa carnosa]
MSKQEIREKTILKMADLAKNKSLEKKRQELVIIDKLLRSEEWKMASSVGLTISQSIEFSTNELLLTALEQKKRVYVPKTMPEKQLAFLPYLSAEQELIKSSYGLLEPSYDMALENNELDLVIVPGVGFNLNNNQRIGFGGGYYDRFIAKHQPTTVSLCLDVQNVTSEQWLDNQFDIKINKILTV